MFRTRDFVLLFTTIVFLVSAIGATIWQQRPVTHTPALVIPNAAISDSDTFTASIAADTKQTREQRILEMRTKIAAAPQMTEPEPVVAVVPEPTDPVEIVATSTVAVSVCPNYAPYIGFWDARALSLRVGDGAILVAQEAVAVTGSTTMQTVLQLPMRSLPTGITACIGTDVIGVANDGSLIRNDELALYSVFNSDTRLGYALDGFPIYGTGTAPVDNCGGRVVAGQYRYELQSDSDTVISCYAAAPTQLP